MDHVSSLDQARAHVAGAERRMAVAAACIDRAAGRIARSDEHVDSSLDRVASGQIRRTLHRQAPQGRRRSRRAP